MGHASRIGRAAASAAALVFSVSFNPFARAAAPISTYEAVAKTGQQAAGAAAGQIYSSLGQPTINASGKLAFLAIVAGPGINPQNERGLWTGSTGALTLAMRGGEVAPGTGGGLFQFPIGTIALNNAGQIFYQGVLLQGSGPITASNDHGLWLYTPGSGTSPVAREGDLIPGGSGVHYGDAVFNGNSLSQNGVVGYLMEVNPDTFSPSGSFGGPAATPYTLGYEGMNVPGIPGRTFTSFSEVNTNASGGVTFQGRFTGTDGLALWAGNPASPTLVARWGSPTPIPGTVYGQLFNSPNLGSGGQLIVHAGLEDATTRALAGSAIFAGPIGALQAVARTGQVAPGTSATFANPSGYPMMNKNNALTFAAALAGVGVLSDNDTGVWAGTKDGANLIAREGDAAPGLAGANFGDFANQDFLWIGDGGWGAFRNTLVGPGVTSNNDQSVWGFNLASGDLILIAREGNSYTIDGVPQTLLGIGSIFSSGGDDGQGTALYGNRFAFTGQFSGYSAEVIATLPEPAAALVAAGAGAIVLARRRPRPRCR